MFRRVLYKARFAGSRSVRRRRRSEDVVAVPRVARAESVRGEAGAPARGSPARAAARQGSVTARVPAPAFALLQRVQRAGRGTHRTGSAPA